MFKRTKKSLAFMLAVLFTVMSVGTVCFAEGSQLPMVPILTLDVSESDPTEVDKTALQAKVDGAVKLKEEDYKADSWVIFAEALADAQIVLGDEEASQGAIDEALLNLEAAIAGLEKIALRIVGEGVSNPLEFSLAELGEMDQYRHKYSTINTWPTKSWYVAEGVTLRELLELAQIDYEAAEQIAFTSRDGFKATFTVQELLEDERFIFPYFRENDEYAGYIPGSPRNAERVETILALKSANTDDFRDMGTKNSLHLVYGQRAQTEQTNAQFAKYVNKVEVLTEAPGKWPEPTASVQPGIVKPGTKVELSSIYNDSDKVHYTLDGSDPTVESPMYNWVAKRWWSGYSNLEEINKPIEITKDTTIKAVVMGPGRENSDIVTFAYEVDSETPFDPNFVVEGGVLTGYTGAGGDVVIPGDRGITVIGPRVFDANKDLTSITIPEGVTEIGMQCFRNCSNLVSVTFPETLVKIGSTCFFKCSGLTEVTLPDSLTEIDNASFKGCDGLTDMILPKGLTRIGNQAFENCGENLSSVTFLSETAVFDGKHIFAGCPNVTIYGYADSTAETYAGENGIPFEVIGDLDKTALRTRVEEAENYKAEDYTEDSWAVFIAALADARGVLEDKAAAQDDVDQALEDLNEAINGLEIAPIPLTVVVKEDGVEIDTIEYDLSKWEDVKRQNYSARNSKFFYRLGAAEGVPLVDLLNDAKIDIDSITGFKFIATDGHASSISKSELLGEERYYYPNIYGDNKEEGAIEVEPILALKSYMQDTGELPSWDIIDKLNTIRLFVGQKDPDDINYGMFAKWICKLEIEMEIEESADKTELQAKVEEVTALEEADYTADSWEIFAEALADAQAILENEEATQEAVDNALVALNEAIEGLEEIVEPIPLAVVVKGKDGTEVLTKEYDMSEWEDVKRQHYSARDSMPATRLAAAEGVYLSDLLEDAGVDIDSVTSFKFFTTDNQSTSISKSEIFDAERYYYPNIFGENREEGKESVEPMLALKSYVGARNNEELPSWDIIDNKNTIRLFFGQENPDDINYGKFIKWICRLEIEVEIEEPDVEVTYETAQDITDINPGSVTFVFGKQKFIIPANVTEFTFKDGEKGIRATYEDGKWMFKAEYIPLDIIIKYVDGSKVEHLNYNIAARDDIKRQSYSIRDSFPDPRQASRLAAAEGVYLRDLLDTFDIDVDDVVNFNFYPNDPWPTPMSKSVLFDEERYYYPNIFEEDQEEGKELVEPMLALRAYVCSRQEFEHPSWDTIDYLNSIRLFFGQTSPEERTYMNCAKWIRKLEIEMETKNPTLKYELTVEDSDDYEIEETEVGLMLTLKQDVTGFKHFGAAVKAVEGKLGQLEVVFTHLRNNVQQSLNSVQADFDADKINAKAGFNIEPGDVIKIYMVDELTNETDRNPIILR